MRLGEDLGIISWITCVKSGKGWRFCGRARGHNTSLGVDIEVVIMAGSGGGRKGGN